MEENNNQSTSTLASTVVHYYGSREPKQSTIETDGVILQMMDDIQISIQPESNKEEEKINIPVSTRKHNILWRFRIVSGSIVILLLVVATVVISELTKEKDL